MVKTWTGLFRNYKCSKSLPGKLSFIPVSKALSSLIYVGLGAGWMLKGWKYLKRRQSFPFFCGSILVSISYSVLRIIFFILAREFESVETFPGFVSLFLVSWSKVTDVWKKLLNDKILVNERCDFTKKNPALLVNLLEKAKSEQKIGKLTVCSRGGLESKNRFF